MAQSRYIHKIDTIQAAIEDLPEADYWHEDTYEAQAGENHPVLFRKVKFKDSRGKCVRWIYDGKIVVK